MSNPDRVKQFTLQLGIISCSYLLYDGGNTGSGLACHANMWCWHALCLSVLHEMIRNIPVTFNFSFLTQKCLGKLGQEAGDDELVNWLRFNSKKVLVKQGGEHGGM